MRSQKTSTMKPAMTQAAIRKLVADSVSATLEAQAANMANTDNITKPREAPVAKKCSYKEFMSCRTINFKGTEGVVGLIRWFERTKSVFSHSNCTEDWQGNDLKTYCEKIPMNGNLMSYYVPDSEKVMEVIPSVECLSIKGNLPPLKPQTLEEALT
ncbi:hypothetical protein Tco_0636852 [Tanacetum coccineum]